MSPLIQFGKGVCSDAEISPERQLMHAQADNEQLKDTLMAIMEAAEGLKGAELIKLMAALGLAKSASP